MGDGVGIAGLGSARDRCKNVVPLPQTEGFSSSSTQFQTQVLNPDLNKILLVKVLEDL